MSIIHPVLLKEIDAFLERSGLSESYFGKAAAGNSEVVGRLRCGGRVWPETEAKLRSFIMLRDTAATKRAGVSSNADIQSASKENLTQGDAA